MEYAVCAQLKVISADFLTSHMLAVTCFLKIDMRSALLPLCCFLFPVTLIALGS